VDMVVFIIIIMVRTAGVDSIEAPIIIQWEV